ncbi:hypothetical protein QJS10_CPA01g00027 [Acorus calamus]|uniref:Uncharacterized protein n=1 Tax=Acorus calamus TaxID=4465 RepID=A0AAV9FH73_ACOCL|nr:hypothetical protein QJS10_CPA01g00027 [Acorus calamus]
MSRCRRLQANVEDTFMDVAVLVPFFLTRKSSLSSIEIFMLLAALDSDDLLYLKEQMEAEEDAERLLRRTEKRAFAAFKISLLTMNAHYLFSLIYGYKAASLADSSSVASVPLALHVESKPKSGIKQQDILKNVVEIRPKRHRVSSPSDGPQGRNPATPSMAVQTSSANSKPRQCSRKDVSSPRPIKENDAKPKNVVGSLLGLVYESSDEG